MSLKQSYNGFKKIKWENKTESQRNKILKKQFENLGYKFPKYLKENKVNDKQFAKAVQRIEKGYENRLAKQIPNVKMSDIQYEVNKFNSLVDRRLKQLKNKGFSDKAIEFLKGKHVFLTTSDRSHFANNSLLEKISIDGLVANKQGRKTTLDIIKKNRQALASNNFNKILNSEDNTENFENLLYNEELFQGMDKASKNYLLQRFNELNVVQQEILLQTTVREIRERYEDELMGEILDNVSKKLSNAIDSIQKEI